jgi:hypothetical protein
MISKPTIHFTFRLFLITLAALTLVGATGYRKPTLAQAVKVSLGQGLTGADLERLKLGHQAGVLKVTNKDGTTTFAKVHGGVSGIDGREWAPLSPTARDQILGALGVSSPGVLANSLMTNYTRISRAHALALLGVLAYPGKETAPLQPRQREKVLQFLRNRLQPAEDNIVRRQAVVALAVQPTTDDVTVAAMLNFLRRDRNAWNTSGVVQFFDYQGTFIRARPQYQAVLIQLAASGNPHAEQIARDLKPKATAQPDPKTEAEPNSEAQAEPKPEAQPQP